MNLSEFKAWFEGFSENLDGPPGPKAWERIQAKIKSIKDAPATSYPVFIERYARPYFPQWTYTSGSIGKGTSGGWIGASQQQQALAYQALTQSAEFNSSAAFRDLGKVEAQAFT